MQHFIPSIALMLFMFLCLSIIDVRAETGFIKMMLVSMKYGIVRDFILLKIKLLMEKNLLEKPYY